MNIRLFHPHPTLKPYIQGYLYLDAIADKSPINLHPVGYNALSFVLNEQKVFDHKDFDYNFRLGHNGHICKHTAFPVLSASTKMIIVPFTSTGAYRLFRVPQRELSNKLLPLDDIIPGAKALKKQLEDMGPDAEKAIAVLQHWLLRQVPHCEINHYAPRIDYTCKLIKSHSGNIRINELCRQVGLSQTGLEDHFNTMVGTSPKLYSRIVRFMAAYKFICRHAQFKWTDLVYRYEYFDQSHFVRDFKTFYGCSPSKIHTLNHQLARNITLQA